MKVQIKEALYSACEKNIAERISAIENILKSIEVARNNETKSSAGDKYETGRAMLQIEENNTRVQLIQAIRVKNDLAGLKLNKKYSKVAPGSLVITDSGKYFISVGLGEISLDSDTYYCVSIAAPIGQALIDRQAGDEIDFKGTTVKILEVC